MSEKLNCVNCGAPIGKGDICPYCGTKYKKEGIKIIQIENPLARHLRADCNVPFGIYDTDMVEKLVKARMAKQMVEKLLEDGLIEMKRFENREHNTIIFRGDIRILEPYYRFGE